MAVDVQRIDKDIADLKETVDNNKKILDKTNELLNDKTAPAVEKAIVDIDLQSRTLKETNEKLNKVSVADINERFNSNIETVKEGVGKLEKTMKDNMGVYAQTFEQHKTAIIAMETSMIHKAMRLEGAMAAATASAVNFGSGTSGGGGGRRYVSLDQDRRYDPLVVITGTENVSTILDWRRKFEMFTEAAIPGANTVLEWARNMGNVITSEKSDSSLSLKIAHRLNQEIYT